MKLTEEEKGYLEKLIKQEESIHQLRYVNLSLGIICLILAFGGYAFVNFWSEFAAADAYGRHPIFYLLGIGGGAGIGFFLQGLKGNPTRRLLISLTKRISRDGDVSR